MLAAVGFEMTALGARGAWMAQVPLPGSRFVTTPIATIGATTVASVARESLRHRGAPRYGAAGDDHR